jgi:hypothetical protein
MSSIQYVGKILSGFAEVFEPLDEAIADGVSLSAFLAEFGWSLDPDSDVNAISEAFQSLPPLIQSVRTAAAAFESSSTSAQAEAIAEAVGQMVIAVKDLATAIDTLSHTTPDTAWPAPLNSDAFWTTFPLALLGYLIYRYLENHHPRIFAPLRLIGFLSEDYSIPLAQNVVPYVRRDVRWDRLILAVTRPQDLPAEVYGWGGPFDAQKLLNNLKGVALAFNVPATLRNPPKGVLDAYYDPAAPSRAATTELSIPILWEITDVASVMALLMFDIGILPIPPANAKGAAAVGLAMYPRLSGSLTETVPLSDSVSLQLKGGFKSDAAIRADVRPDSVGIFVDPVLSLGIDAAATIDAKPPTPWIPLGHPTSSRLELRHAHTSVEAKGTVPDIEFIIALAADDAALIIQFDEGDGFLRQILGDDPKTVTMSLGLTWSSKRGFQLSGQAKLEVTLPLHVSIADVIDIDSITLGFGASTVPAGIGLSVAITGGLTIGPVAASVDRVGVQATLAAPTPPATSGNLGAVDLGFAFLPPKGLGLSIDAGPVSGGGYILFDSDAGRYAGILELTLPVLSIEVIGLLDTKLPGGERGFSLLLIVACNFPPIQLGYGFVLSGLGGLAGINRSIVVRALQDGVHSGAVDHILFPVDPVAHAAELITDLETIFPPKEGEYVFGPMAELGWGAPDPLIIAQLGIILILPNPLVIVLLGKLEIVLPQPDSAVVDLKMEIAGSLDITNKLFAMDMSLAGSRILTWSVAGDVSLRLAFGARPNFAFAIGGFHPHFQPPPDFPPLQRLSISLSTGDNPRLSLETYLAVTANTVQVGAKASAYVKFGDFSANGELGFDAIFHFQPFSFIVDVEANLAVNGPLGFSASVHFDGHLSGLDPVRCWGSVVIDFLGKHTFPIDIPFGQPVEAAPTTPPNPWSELQKGIARTANWTPALPDANHRFVAVTRSQGSDTLTFVDPAGGLTLRQKAVPLDTDINKFGEARLATSVRFGITTVNVGSLALGTNAFSPTSEPFAAAQFEQMSDADRLSRPSFEPMHAGVAVAADAIDFGPMRGRDYSYATFVVDAPKPTKPYLPASGVLAAALRTAPSANAPARNNGLGKYSPPSAQPAAAGLARARYVIADVTTLDDATSILANAPSGGIPIPDPPEKGAMSRALAAYYGKSPADRGKYAVMGNWELI